MPFGRDFFFLWPLQEGLGALKVGGDEGLVRVKMNCSTVATATLADRLMPAPPARYIPRHCRGTPFKRGRCRRDV